MARRSRFAFFISCLLLLASSMWYYPKWKQANTEATLSWDVSGYYLYLPAAIIYKDIKQLAWWESVSNKYHPGPGMGQAFKHPSGNYVMKYPMGQALQFLPWFLTAHLIAEPLGYPADGFSMPYQAAIGWGSLLVAFLGLWVLRRVLRVYFTDAIVAAVLISIVFGSNYLEYAGITGAMTHNWLFTAYSLLLYATVQFYKKPSWKYAVMIGGLIGWVTLTRPTEIIAVMVPLAWGVYSMPTLRARIQVFKKHYLKLLGAALLAGMVMFLQCAYWKYATGEWIVYSYEAQGFTWFPPHIEDVLWSARAGWLVYSPIMIFAVAGLFMLRKRVPDVFPTVALYCLSALYITSAWDIWWYGGSLGQRAMVQAYPFWAFALGAFWSWVSRRQWRTWLFVLLAVACSYLNLWWSHQAHRGGLFVSEQMTRRYMLKILGKTEVARDWLKFLDTRDEFTGGDRMDIRPIFATDFEKDTTAAITTEKPVAGQKSLLLNQEKQFSPEFELPVKPGETGWIRATTTFQCEPKEWDWWAMTQFLVRFRQGDKVIKDRMVRLQRHVDGGEVKTLFFDTQIPDKPFDRVTVLFWNAGSNKTIRIDDLQVELFR
jgi:hypothetical protein